MSTPISTQKRISDISAYIIINMNNSAEPDVANYGTACSEAVAVQVRDLIAKEFSKAEKLLGNYMHN